MNIGQNTPTGYEDIINLPHHVSTTRPRMPRLDRAAQFSPFAALDGFEDAIQETGRLTETRPGLDEDRKAELNTKLQTLFGSLKDCPETTITFFRHDSKKSGGACVTVSGRMKKADLDSGLICLENTETIPIEDILEIEIP